MKLKFYAYKNCDTCRKAIKYLDEKGEGYELIPIREQPPTKAELKTMLASHDGNTRKLFNTSGGDYKALNLKEKLPNMTKTDAIDLLSKTATLLNAPSLSSGIGALSVLRKRSGASGSREWLLPELGEETGVGTGEVGGALVGEKAAVNLDVVLQHLEAVA